MRRPAGWAIATAALASSFSTGCSGCKITDAPVSTTGNPGSTVPDHFAFQSETSIARIDALNGQGDRAPHYVVSYNDATSVETPDPDATTCWDFTGTKSLDGWATSDDFGEVWTRHPQLAPTSEQLQSRHGDTWLAAWNNPSVMQGPFPFPSFDGSVVLMVSVGQAGVKSLDGPWGLYVNRMIFGTSDSTIDLTRDTEVALVTQSTNDLPDGPKVAIRGDGTRALIAWQPNLQFIQVTDLHTTIFFGPTPMTFGPRKNVNPLTAFGSPPDPSCTSTSWVGATHVQIAAGASFFYALGEWDYACSSGQQRRLEVYRTRTGDTWERILSVAPPQHVQNVLPQHLSAQNIAATPSFGAFVDRGDEGPSLAAGFAADGDYLLLVTDQAQAGDPTKNEATREKVVQYRLPRADTCVADKRDLFSCDGVQNLPFQEVDGLAKPISDFTTIASRVGVWESKPHVFTGNLPDGHTIDNRVGIVWYTQPYKGLMTADDEMKARTIVEAVVSSDGGQTYGGPFNMLQGTSVEKDDPAIGLYFHPCQFLLPGTSCHSNGYYGEYITGAFQTSFPANNSIIGVWGDSREGCTKQGLPTVHQHVWSGATRSKDFKPPPTCGLQSQECCSTQPACTGSLSCQKGFCAPSINLCASCDTQHNNCLLACADDPQCSCLCDNSFCRCQMSRGCNPHCTVKGC